MVWSRNYPIKQVLLCAATLIILGNASSNGNPGEIPEDLGEPVSSSQGYYRQCRQPDHEPPGGPLLGCRESDACTAPGGRS